MRRSIELEGAILIAGFALLFVAVAYIVHRILRSQGWEDLGTPANPIVIRSRAVSRCFGLLLFLGGCTLIWWSWADARTQRQFMLKTAAGGPIAACMGAWMAITGPLSYGLEASKNRGASVAIVMLTGLGIGLLYVEFLRTGHIPLLHWFH